MSDPKFKAGDKAEFDTDGRWEAVQIESHGLRYAARYYPTDYMYVVQYVDVPQRLRGAFLVLERHLRPVDRWVDCPGRHREVGIVDGVRIWERRVE